MSQDPVDWIYKNLWYTLSRSVEILKSQKTPLEDINTYIRSARRDKRHSMTYTADVTLGSIPLKIVVSFIYSTV